MAPRAIGLTPEAFQSHWRSEHASAAGGIPGLRRYVQNHQVLENGVPLLPYPGVDACSEIEFDSLAAMDEGFASDYYQGPVTEDEHVLIDKSRFLLLLCERRVLDDRPVPDDAVKLLTLMPLSPGATHADLDAVLAGPYRDAVAGAGPLRHEQLLEIPGGHEGRQPPPCAATDILWFAGPAEAVAFLRSEPAQRARYELAGRAFGLERILARPVDVA
jgi:uncharacterized protein (TIGR02118 family)